MYTLGIDIGSTTTKCVILEDGKHIVAHKLQVGGIGTNVVEQLLKDLMEVAGLSRNDISATTVTGYGRKIYKEAETEVSELTCHALGCRFLFEDVNTVIVIGGQDIKIITLNKNGGMKNFLMNDKCAAGTGRFLDVMARILNLEIHELEVYASQATNSASISSTCTVFAESEVISQLATGVELPDLVAGICDSVSSRVSALAKRANAKEPICMSGGVARNSAVREGIGRGLGTTILYDKYSQYFGAIGASIWAYRQMKK